VRVEPHHASGLSGEPNSLSWPTHVSRASKDCVTCPGLALFLTSAGAGPQSKGQLRVEVVYPDSENPVFHPVGSLTADSRAWQASADMPVFPERGGAAAGMRRVALRFTSVEVDDDGGAWRLDDLYVDPTRRN
jgi:hypothetical protein